jgi:hypothetical protein
MQVLLALRPSRHGVKSLAPLTMDSLLLLPSSLLAAFAAGTEQCVAATEQSAAAPTFSA